MIRILVVDDQNIVRQGIQALLAPKLDIEVVGTAQDGYQALEQIQNLQPDVVLIDIEMPRMDGLAATHQISQKFPQVKVLVLSSHEKEEYATKVLKAGAKGYLFKNALSQDLEQAIHLVNKGYSQIEPKLLEKLMAKAFAYDYIDSKEKVFSTPNNMLEQNTSFDLKKAALSETYEAHGKRNLETNRGSVAVKQKVVSTPKNKVEQNTSFDLEVIPENEARDRRNSKTTSKTEISQLPTSSSNSIAKTKKFPLKRLMLVPVLAFLVGVGLYTRNLLSSTTQAAPLSLRVSGRIEGYETNIGTKIGGKVKSISLQEGDKVKKGQLIARIDDAELQAQLQGTLARIDVARQQEKQANLQINFLESQIQEAKLNLQQNQENTKGKVFEAESSMASSASQLNEAIAKLQQVQSEFKLAQTNRDRFAQLLDKGAISQQRFDEVQTAFETAQTKVEANQASVNSFQKLTDSAKGQLIQAQTTQLNPNISNAKIKGLQTQIEQARSKIVAAKAEVNNAQAAQREIQSKAADLNITSPINGIVTVRTVEPGEVIASGQPVLSLINPKTVYLRGYIPEGQIGKIKVGQKAKLFLDSAPKQGLDAKITAIDSKASFTPENIYFFEDRVKQVFGVKISIENPNGFAKPGLPADAEIKIDSEIDQ